MKTFLTKPRSIAGTIILDTLTAIAVFFSLVVADFLLSIYRNEFGPARQIDAIASGNGYSISLDATPAHPMLAEYTQSLSIFGGQPRQGSMLGRVELPMNTGGRVAYADSGRAGIDYSSRRCAPRVLQCGPGTASGSGPRRCCSASPAGPGLKWNVPKRQLFREAKFNFRSGVLVVAGRRHQVNSSTMKS